MNAMSKLGREVSVFTVQKLLFVGFSLVVGLFIALSVIMIYELGVSNDHLVKMHDEELQPLIDSAEANLALLEMDKELLALSIEIDPSRRQGFVTKMGEEERRMFDHLKEIEDTADETESQALEKFTQAYQVWSGVRRRATSLCLAGKLTEAQHLIEREGEVPFDQADQALSAIVRHNETSAEERYQKAEEDYDRQWMLVVVLSSLATFLAMGAGIFITRRVVGPLSRVTDALSATSTQLTASAEQIGSNAEETSTQANMVSSAAEEVSKNVQTGASGVEEMASSIREIAKNAAEAARVASSAVQVTDSTNNTISKLGESSNEIGQVIKVITSVAEQTNLLALNATIEAARAGEAGKGFALVANEVKELAKETAKATEEIGQKIGAIQVDTKDSVDAIEKITNIIKQINDISTSIAGSVEEQSTTTSDIGRNVAEAAAGSQQIAQNITGVATAAQSTSQGVSDTRNAASQIVEVTDELVNLIGGNGSGRNFRQTAPHGR